MASVRKRGNSYQITVSNGRDINNKQIIETTTWKPDPDKTDKQNQKALERFVIDFEDKVKAGKRLNGEKLTYQEYIELWLSEYAANQLEQTTIEYCRNSFNNIILPAIGHLKLTEIQPLHLQKLYNSLSEKGYTRNGTNYKYKPNSIKRLHQTISSTLSTAVQWQLIESNPCQRVKPPKVVKDNSIKCFTPEQVKAFLAFLDEPYTVMHCGRMRKNGSESNKHYDTKNIPLQYKCLFNLAIFGGFRRGELIALTWDDIDFHASTVSISKAAARTKSGTINKSPKTVTSNRVITIPPAALEMLLDYQEEQRAYRLSLGSYWMGDNYIFIQDNGKQMDISTPNKVFKKIIHLYNLKHPDDLLPDITLHGLRHTSATLLIGQNVDIKTVSHRLGHADTSTTIDIYAHALEKLDKDAADKLANLLKST